MTLITSVYLLLNVRLIFFKKQTYFIRNSNIEKCRKELEADGKNIFEHGQHVTELCLYKLRIRRSLEKNEDKNKNRKDKEKKERKKVAKKTPKKIIKKPMKKNGAKKTVRKEAGKKIVKKPKRVVKRVPTVGRVAQRKKKFNDFYCLIMI